MAKDAKGRSRITAQGQVSVPARVREALGLYAGSVLEWETEGDRVTVRRVGTRTSEDVRQALFGSERPARRTLTELKDGIRQYIRAKHARD
jgi:AbrB family looped-hinge helix DNA binding protein